MHTKKIGYFYFFIFYFLFYTFHFMFDVSISNFFKLSLTYQLFSFLFTLVFLHKVFFVNKKYTSRYGFAFLTAASDLILRCSLLLADNLTESIFSSKFNIIYIESNLYLMSLIFALIQLGIEYFHGENIHK